MRDSVEQLEIDCGEKQRIILVLFVRIGSPFKTPTRSDLYVRLVVHRIHADDAYTLHTSSSN